MKTTTINNKICIGTEKLQPITNIKKVIETEVIVCGGGTSGIIAAISAAENGAKVILLEKNNSCYPPRDYIGAVGSKAQKEHGIEINKNEIVNELCRYACYRVDQRLLNLWANESGEMIDWLCDIMQKGNMGVYVEDDVNKDMQMKEWSTNHMFYSLDKENKTTTLKVLVNKMQAVGVNIMLKTPMVELVTEGEKVVGVIAKNENNEYIQINASKGVVLATGGYSNNIEMLQQLNPVDLSNATAISNTPSVTGDGIKAGTWVGAEKDPIPTTMLFDRMAVKPGCAGGPPFEPQIFWLGSQPFLQVNKFGERYANESVPYDFGVHSASMQPDRVWCSIFDSNWREDVLAYHTIGCSRVVLPEDTDKYPKRFDMTCIEGMNEKLLKSGYMQQADTIEELAEKLMIPQETLKTTVERYNELCEKGEDEDFGKESFRMRGVAKPPFFGVTVGGLMLCTLDGLRINTNMQVLNKSMKPIEGLYAVGNDSGSFFAYTYPELVVGVAAGRGMTFGRHVGKYLANL